MLNTINISFRSDLWSLILVGQATLITTWPQTKCSREAIRPDVRSCLVNLIVNCHTMRLRVENVHQIAVIKQNDIVWFKIRVLSHIMRDKRRRGNRGNKTFRERAWGRVIPAPVSLMCPFLTTCCKNNYSTSWPIHVENDQTNLVAIFPLNPIDLLRVLLLCL